MLSLVGVQATPREDTPLDGGVREAFLEEVEGQEKRPERSSRVTQSQQ